MSGGTVPLNITLLLTRGMPTLGSTGRSHQALKIPTTTIYYKMKNLFIWPRESSHIFHPIYRYPSQAGGRDVSGTKKITCTPPVWVKSIVSK